MELKKRILINQLITRQFSLHTDKAINLNKDLDMTYSYNTTIMPKVR